MSITKNKSGKRLITQMPKIELHLHLEGAFTFEFLFDLIEKYGGDRSIRTPDKLKEKFVFRDFEHFLDLWFWKNKFFREAEDFEKCAYLTLKNLSKQNVIYTELFYSPWDFVSNGLSVEEITEAIISGIKKAENELPIKCNLIADIVRDHDYNNAVERVRQIIPYKGRGIVGIGLGGSEHLYPAGLFKDAFEFAAQSGFRLTAHAGEAAGPESIWETIRHLKVERIGHGVRAVEDPELVDFLRDQQIPLEICVSSNLKTNIFSSIELHPIRNFLDKGIRVTVNSDDPTMFGANITDEFLNLYNKIHLSYEEIQRLTINAIIGAFISEEKKERLKQKINLYWMDQTSQ